MIEAPFLVTPIAFVQERLFQKVCQMVMEISCYRNGGYDDEADRFYLPFLQ